MRLIEQAVELLQRASAERPVDPEAEPIRQADQSFDRTP